MSKADKLKVGDKIRMAKGKRYICGEILWLEGTDLTVSELNIKDPLQLHVKAIDKYGYVSWLYDSEWELYSFPIGTKVKVGTAQILCEIIQAVEPSDNSPIGYLVKTPKSFEIPYFGISIFDTIFISHTAAECGVEK